LIHQGDALNVLKTFEDESIDCCVTSPPYWALRDYKVKGQLGLEPTFHEYIDKLCTIFDQVKRVLKKTGACWVVLGDTYSNNGGVNQPQQNSKGGVSKSDGNRNQEYVVNTSSFSRPKSNMPDKSLCMIPERFSIEMINRGWILRNKIIWHKPNCMPSSAKDRFTVDWEYVFFFTKSQKYYFETQYEPHGRNWNTEAWTKKEPRKQRLLKPKHRLIDQKDAVIHSFGIRAPEGKTVADYFNPLGRIKRCVWKISTKPYSGAHFAVFPPELIRDTNQGYLSRRRNCFRLFHGSRNDGIGCIKER
jgi:DNA modification methylase